MNRHQERMGPSEKKMKDEKDVKMVWKKSAGFPFPRAPVDECNQVFGKVFVFFLVNAIFYHPTRTVCYMRKLPQCVARARESRYHYRKKMGPTRSAYPNMTTVERLWNKNFCDSIVRDGFYNVLSREILCKN